MHILILITRPHTLPAQQLHLAHLAPALSVYSHELRSRQEVLQSDNVEMLERVMKQRKEIEALVKGLEDSFTDVEASVGNLRAEEVGPVS